MLVSMNWTGEAVMGPGGCCAVPLRAAAVTAMHAKAQDARMPGYLRLVPQAGLNSAPARHRRRLSGRIDIYDPCAHPCRLLQCRGRPARRRLDVGLRPGAAPRP